MAVFNGRAEVIITNFETISSELERMRLFLKTRNVAIVIDESTKIKNPEKQTVYISHCDVYDDALSLKNYLVEHGVKNVEIYFYDLITGSHIGPDSLALFYVGENRD